MKTFHKILGSFLNKKSLIKVKKTLSLPLDSEQMLSGQDGVFGSANLPGPGPVLQRQSH